MGDRTNRPGFLGPATKHREKEAVCGENQGDAWARSIVAVCLKASSVRQTFTKPKSTMSN